MKYIIKFWLLSSFGDRVLTTTRIEEVAGTLAGVKEYAVTYVPIGNETVKAYEIYSLCFGPVSK